MSVPRVQGRRPNLQFRPVGCSKELPGARCQIFTGTRWLAYARRTCPGSVWRWVAAYGMRRCPTEQEAGMRRGPRVAKRHYMTIGGTQWP
jgi:hypothetical protein